MALLELKGALEGVLQGPFQGAEAFAHALKEAFEHFINQRANKPAELIAKFLDGELRGQQEPERGGAGGRAGPRAAALPLHLGGCAGHCWWNQSAQAHEHATGLQADAASRVDRGGNGRGRGSSPFRVPCLLLVWVSAFRAFTCGPLWCHTAVASETDARCRSRVAAQGSAPHALASIAAFRDA